MASQADVLAYMDVDLSTDLNALLPLVAPLLSGHSDLAIVQAVTTAHGGSVSVTSRPGHTSFVITLPRLTSVPASA